MPGDWQDRLAANLGLLWAGLPIPEAIGKAARAGFAAVELHAPGDCPATEVRAACEATGVPLLGVNTPSPLAAQVGRRAEFRAEFEPLLAWCLSAKARWVHVMPGSAADLAAAEACLIENLAWAAERAAAQGLVILLEPLNRYDRPGWVLPRPDDAARVIAAVGQPNVGMQLDAYHTAREGLDPLAQMARHAGIVRHIQIAGVPHRDEPDGGEFDYAGFLTGVEASGYDGWIGCEYKPRTTVEAGLDWRQRLQDRMHAR